MKSFNEYLLEFDPNRGAPGRAKTIVPHYPTKDEVLAADKTTPNLKGLKRSNLNTRIRELDKSNHPEASRLAAFSAGKAGRRWQGTGNDTADEMTSQMAAHRVGEKIRLPRLPRKGEASVPLDNLEANTPAAHLQRKIEAQEDQIQKQRPGAMLDIRGYRR